ncbi:MAG: hypothetical protein RL039_800, partial [Pseudomonadota bacterium]
MIYEWDEAKRLANLKKHGIDFLDADLVMESEFVWIVDSSRNSEPRYQNVFTISSWVCGRGFGRSASLQILAIAKLLLWFAPRNPSR